MQYRYSQWDGSQSVNPFTAEELMDAMSDDLIADNNMQSALQRLMRQVDRGQMGERMQNLRQMMEQLRQKRQEQLQRNDLSSVMDDIKQRLEEIVETERAGIDRRLQEMTHASEADDRGGDQDPQQPTIESQQSVPSAEAQPGAERKGNSEANQAGQKASNDQEQRDGQQGQQQASQHGDPDLQKLLEQVANRKQRYLDELPEDPAGQIKSLQQYEFMDNQAREKFEELMNMLRQQMMQQFSRQMQQSMQSMTPEDMQRLREMVQDINKTMEAKAQGRDPKFDDFKQKYGDIFPDVNSLEELMRQLQERRMQMENLLNSMPGDMRQSLRDMLQQMLQDDRLNADLAKMAQQLEQFVPSRQFRQQFNFSGDEAVNFSEAMRLMEQMQQMDQLEKQLRQAREGRGMENIDPQMVADLLGPEAAEAIRQLQDIGKILEEAGYIRKNGNRYELTPRGMRKIGQKAVKDIFSALKRDRVGKHETDHRGSSGDRTDDTKVYEFSDPFLLDLRGTVMNAVEREGKGSPIHLVPQDFEVYRTELLTQTSTVLMIDLSRSMLLRGCFAAAKKVAIALDSLIRAQYPRDNFYIVGFDAYARQLKPHDLHDIDWDEDRYGTNLQHGLMLSRKLLGKHKGGNRQVIVITDGEPTAHIEPDGQVYFNYPTSVPTYNETMKEIVRCTRDGIVINTFMLTRDPSLAWFVNQMSKINKGRALFAEPDRLGEYLLVDYVRNRKKRVS